MGSKNFYTQRDIEDMVAQGATTLTLTAEVVLTDLARDRANELGLTLVAAADVKQVPAPASAAAVIPAVPGPDELAARIKATVIARMGTTVPESLLDAIIPRILAEIQSKHILR
jgi:hypothetical protein